MKILHTLFRFRGGVHPPEFKLPAAAVPLRVLPTPKQLAVSTAQHLGTPAKPCVQVGDVVRAGQTLAAAQGLISAAVHAPLAGKIVAIEEAAPTPAGRPAPALVLEPDGSEAWSDELPPIPEWRAQEPRTLVARVAAAGVVGMGGAGFPTHVKLSPPADKPIDTLILNGAECEPYLSSDHRLMLERAREIWSGCRIIRHILGAKTVRVAIEDNKPDAVRALSEVMGDDEGDVAVVVLKTRYPHGSEKQQIFAVTGRTVPAGGLPMDVGCLVENVGTALAVHDAVVNGRPLVARSITVTGDAVAQPGNWMAPVGTRYADLVAACGGPAGKVAKAIAGGPMMGFALPSLDVAMNKTSSGLLLLSPRRVGGYSSQACIGCGRCVDACPMRLMPSELSQVIEADDIDSAEPLNVMDCFECGACAYVCPARRPLVQHMRRAKAVVLQRRRQAQAQKPAAKA